MAKRKKSKGKPRGKSRGKSRGRSKAARYRAAKKGWVTRRSRGLSASLGLARHRSYGVTMPQKRPAIANSFDFIPARRGEYVLEVSETLEGYKVPSHSQIFRSSKNLFAAAEKYRQKGYSVKAYKILADDLTEPVRL